MSNVLKVSHQEAIRSLYEKGWSQHRIARELGLHRQTVGRYIETDPKCTSISTAGADVELLAKCTSNSTTGSQEQERTTAVGRKSLCEPLRESIRERLDAGLSAQRIYQDLVEGGFAGFATRTLLQTSNSVN